MIKVNILSEKPKTFPGEGTQSWHFWRCVVANKVWPNSLSQRQANFFIIKESKMSH